MNPLQRITAIPALALCALISTGCDKDALAFASRTAKLLEDYRGQLTNEISAAEDYYRRYAAVETDSAQKRASGLQAVALLETADKWSIDYIQQVKDTARVREQLLDAATTHFEETQKRWLNEIDQSRIYLDRIEKLQAGKEKAEALAKLLESLAQKRSLATEAKEIGKFIEATKEELDKKICENIAGTLKQTDLPADRKAALEQLSKDRKCPAQNS